MAAPPRSPPTLRLSHTALDLSSRQVVLVLQVSAATGTPSVLLSCFPSDGQEEARRANLLSLVPSLLNPRQHTAGQPSISAFSRN